MALNFLLIGKNVDDVQDELKNLLFGADQANRHGNQTEKVNSKHWYQVWRFVTNKMNIYFQERNPPDVDEDLALEFEEDYSDRRSDDPDDAPQAVRLYLF